jgi:folate-dependent tRNA-U54 methylase TrmFO/GidA
VDIKFKVNKKVMVIFTLPSGQKEIVLDYDMCFVDREGYENYKDETEEAENNNIHQFESNLKNKIFDNFKPIIPVSSVDPEY